MKEIGVKVPLTIFTKVKLWNCRRIEALCALELKVEILVCLFATQLEVLKRVHGIVNR